MALLLIRHTRFFWIPSQKLQVMAIVPFANPYIHTNLECRPLLCYEPSTRTANSASSDHITA